MAMARRSRPVSSASALLVAALVGCAAVNVAQSVVYQHGLVCDSVSA